MKGMSKQVLVVKIGTSSILESDGLSIHLGNFGALVHAIANLHRAGFNVVLVSSGAVGVGMLRLGMVEKPPEISKRQALAAVGQPHLMRLYEDFFGAAGIKCSQVLLSFENLAHKAQYHNAKNTFDALFSFGVVPIVNENDTVANEEIRFGDNDRLSAMVAGLVRSDWLFLLTDVDALYTSNPKENPDAKRIAVVDDLKQLDSLLVGDLSAGSRFGTGGMQSKIIAARLGAAQGTKTIIMSSKDPSKIKVAMDNTGQIGTVILPLDNPVSKTKRWIVGLPSLGKLVVDQGAKKAILGKSSLFPAGIKEVVGTFPEHSVIAIVGLDGEEIGRGLVNYCSTDLAKIASHNSDDFEGLLGYVASEHAVHRSNIILLSSEDAPPPTT